MARGGEVLEMLIPTGGWVIYGDDFDSIIYSDGVKPISKEEFDAGFAKVDAYLKSESKAQEKKKQDVYKVKIPK